MSKQITEIKEPFDLALADAELANIKEITLKKQEVCRAREKEIFDFLAKNITDNCKIHRPNTGVKVHISNRKISIRYYYNLEKHDSVEVDVTLAEKWDVYEWNEDKKPMIEKLGIKLGDVYEIRTSSVGFNIVKANSRDTINDVLDYVNICQYIINDFQQKENGYFFNKAKTFLAELVLLWDDISAWHTKRNELHREREKYLLDVYEKEFSAPGLIKEGNVILIKKKKTDFECLDAHHITEWKRLLYKTESFYVDVKHMHYDRNYTEEFERYHLEIDSRHKNDDKKQKIDVLMRSLARHKYEGDEIEIVDLKYWNDYCEMLRMETEHISQSTQEEFLTNFAEKSKYYEGIYMKKNSRD